jgi:hypothetical protein
MNNQKLIQKALLAATACCCLVGQAMAQNVDQIRWKNTEQVRAILGEPQSITPPIGTHASYTMWQYDTYTVAFANGKAFHLFGKNSLRNIDLRENRRANN